MPNDTVCAVISTKEYSAAHLYQFRSRTSPIGYLVIQLQRAKNMKKKNMKKMKMEDFEVRSLVFGTCSLAFKVSLQRGCSIFNPT